MGEVIIKIKEVLGSDIRIRSRVTEIAKLTREASIYNLDFSGVRFISRSFADELITLLQHSQGRITIVNVKNEVSDMLKAVEKGRNQAHTTKHTGKVQKLDSMEDLAVFFS